MGKVKELESEIPEFNPDTHRWDWKLKKVVELTPEELAEIARQKRKADLEKRFSFLNRGNQIYNKVFGVRSKIINGEKHFIHRCEEIAEWDRDDLDDFEQKVLKLEAAKKEMDDKEIRERPMLDRRNEYRKIDELLFEAIAEKQENKAEKMEEYLKLRNEIKARFPK
jgi:MFS superfamily sulfate permease-like transporter